MNDKSDLDKLETKCDDIREEISKVLLNNVTLSDFINHAEDLKLYILSIKTIIILDSSFISYLAKLEIESKVIIAKIKMETEEIEYESDDQDSPYKYDRDAGLIDHIDFFLH